MALDLSSLENARAALDTALERAALEPNDELVRDGCIQRFEHTYELSWKMLRRHLAMTAANPSDIDGISYPNLIREGLKNSLIDSSIDDWLRYRTARGSTSHAYDRRKAEEVFALIPAFARDARSLLSRLKTAQP